LAEQLFSIPVVTAARVETTGHERNRIYEAPAILNAVYGSLAKAKPYATEAFCRHARRRWCDACSISSTSMTGSSTVTS